MCPCEEAPAAGTQHSQRKTSMSFQTSLQSAHCILQLLYLLAVKALPFHMRPRALQQVLAVVPEVAQAVLTGMDCHRGEASLQRGAEGASAWQVLSIPKCC